MLHAVCRASDPPKVIVEITTPFVLLVGVGFLINAKRNGPNAFVLSSWILSPLRLIPHDKTLAASSVTVFTLFPISEGERLRPLPVHSADGSHSSPTVEIRWVLEWPSSPLSAVSVISRHCVQELRDPTASLWWQQTSVCESVSMSDSALKGSRPMSSGLWDVSTHVVLKPIRVGVSENKLCWLNPNQFSESVGQKV